MFGIVINKKGQTKYLKSKMLSLFTYSKTVDLGFRNYCGSMKLEITKASTFQCTYTF